MSERMTVKQALRTKLLVMQELLTEKDREIAELRAENVALRAAQSRSLDTVNSVGRDPLVQP